MSESNTVLQEMLDAVPDTYQKTVGFPTWDWLAAASIPMAQTDAELAEARRQLDPANLTGDALDAYIFPRTGQQRTPATYAEGVLTATGNGTIYEGALFESGGGVQFVATETVVIAGSGTVPIRCVTPGAVGNLPAGSVTMMPVQIAGIVSVINQSPTAEGYEAETDEAYYQRFLLRLQTPPTSGNQYHYLEWAMEVSGVGGVQLFPLDQGANTVGVVLVDQFGKPASAELVEQVQEHIDPGSQGIGEGEAPIGAYCYVSAATAQTVDLSLTVTPTAGSDQETVTAAIQAAVTDYLREEALEAYTPSISGEKGYRVSYARIGSAILDTEGVDDYEGLTVNGGTGNLTVPEKYAAVLGEVTVSYGT